MANAIKSVPTLKGKDAATFVKMAKSSEKKRETVDFTQQSIIARKILAKAGLK